MVEMVEYLMTRRLDHFDHIASITDQRLTFRYGVGHFEFTQLIVCSSIQKSGNYELMMNDYFTTREKFRVFRRRLVVGDWCDLFCKLSFFTQFWVQGVSLNFGTACLNTGLTVEYYSVETERGCSPLEGDK